MIVELQVKWNSLTPYITPLLECQHYMQILCFKHFFKEFNFLRKRKHLVVSSALDDIVHALKKGCKIFQIKENVIKREVLSISKSSVGSFKLQWNETVKLYEVLHTHPLIYEIKTHQVFNSINTHLYLTAKRNICITTNILLIFVWKEEIKKRLMFCAVHLST